MYRVYSVRDSHVARIMRGSKRRAAYMRRVHCTAADKPDRLMFGI